MKRRLAIMMTFVLLLLTCAAAFPATAATGGDWKTISYTLIPLEEGEEPVGGTIAVDSKIERSCTISCDTEKTELRVNGETVESGYTLAIAGEYNLTAVNKADPDQKATYSITVLPDINLEDGQVFTSYPTLTCTNALYMEYSRNLTRPAEFVSGTTITELGSHLLTIYGRDAKGNKISVASCRFYVKACHAVRVFDEESGKEALDVIVAEFEEGPEVAAVLDGERELSVGSNIVTEIGAHTLAVKLDGALLEIGQALPDYEELTLRVELNPAALESKEPFYFELSRWDAEFLLDGEVVTEDIRVGDHGTHTLAVKGQNGDALAGALRVKVGNSDEEKIMSELTFTFNNPHMIYVIIVAVPAVLLLIAAGYFLVARRKVV